MNSTRYYLKRLEGPCKTAEVMTDEMIAFVGHIQREHAQWQLAQFGETPMDALFLGLLEEQGELARHLLKGMEGIRGGEEQQRAKMIDAVGDIMLYLLGVMDRANINFEEDFPKYARDYPHYATYKPSFFSLSHCINSLVTAADLFPPPSSNFKAVVFGVVCTLEWIAQTYLYSTLYGCLVSTWREVKERTYHSAPWNGTGVNYQPVG